MAAAVFALSALAPTGARANASLVADMGCLNCHGAQPRGDAPSFKRMQERAANRTGGGNGPVQHWMEEMRETGTGWRAIVGHRQVSDQAARAVLEWLAKPEVKPIN